MRFVFHLLLCSLLVVILPQCSPSQDPPPKGTLREARQHFATSLTRHDRLNEPPPDPPTGILQLVRYTSPAGKLAAYVGSDPGDGLRHPAILWLTGGFSSSISEVAWTPGPEKNDQSATAFREAGLIMMYPSYRGGNDNPGDPEGFYGEVDDVLSAAVYLSSLSYVDPNRIYLAGHSTGGTLALLAAECSTRFRAVFAFGPVADVAGYGAENLPFDLKDPREFELRAPGRWLHCITTPTFVLEGHNRSNVSDVLQMANSPHPAAVQFHLVKHADHFSVLQPLTRVIAKKIVQDTGPEVVMTFPDDELAAAFHP